MILLSSKSKKRRKIVGRGWGSGHGKTSGKGNKGQGSRSGTGKPRLGFEGGQMPLIRSVPKRGFNNNFKKVFQEVNIEQIVKKFHQDDIISNAELYRQGIIKSEKKPVKLLGNGQIDFPVMLKVAAVTKPAKEKIEKAGGKIEVSSGK